MAKTKAQKIKETPYGMYFEQLARETGISEPDLAGWWNERGVIRYMELKHADNGANNAVAVMRLLVEEVKNAGI